MSKIEWVTAPQIEVGGSARPDSVADEHGIQNSVAIITLTNRHSGDAVVIEGRPEHLLNLARAQLRVAEQIVEVTMRDPQLRAMYGLTSVEDPPELPQVGATYVKGGPDVTPDGGAYCGEMDSNFVCTRSPDGHSLHAAGNGTTIVHVWGEPDAP